MKRDLINKLIDWKASSNRKPLIIHGARQVGKTYLVKEFGKQYYDNTIYVNFETNKELSSQIDDSIDAKYIINKLELFYGEKIIPGKTLIFFDEIQANERALTSLKYFCEDAPQYHVAAAGSLLGVAVNRQRYSFPVGKVETMTLYPFDFEEFLWARERAALAEDIRTAFETLEPLPEGLHQQAVELYREYLIVGGMPACVKAFLQEKSFLDVSLVQSQIIDNYVADMAKYASASDTVKIRACYQSIPAQLAKENRKFQYKVVQKGGSATIFGASIEWLNLAGVVLKCQKISHAYEPVSVHMELASFKLYMGDVGLLTMKSGIAQQTVLSDMENQFLGALAENYVAQQLTARGYELFYWESDGSAELDFVLQKGREIIGIEVKSGLNVRSRSLSVFNGKYQPAYNIRFSLRNFGQVDNLKSVPLYAAFCV